MQKIEKVAAVLLCIFASPRKKEIDLQPPDFLQIAGCQGQCPFSLSATAEEDQGTLHVCWQRAHSISMV